MTKIEWTEQTWNPIAGCSIISPGCKNCYAMKMAARLEAIGTQSLSGALAPHFAEHYRGLTKKVNGNVVWTGKVAMAPDHTLLAPLRRRKPAMYFVNSMSDLFHEDVPDEWIDRIFAVMALCPQHTFQVLTKRSKRMQEYVMRVGDGPDGLWPAVVSLGEQARARKCPDVFPLPNVWLGVSAERQQEADERIPHLLATPAAVRFVSYEPALGPLKLWEWDKDGAWRGVGIVRSGGMTASTPDSAPEGYDDSYPGIDWVICGGESGNGARPMHPEWARSVRDQCSMLEVPFFFKQWGAHAPASVALPGDHLEQDADIMCRVGKKAAGRLLDGRIWDEMPTLGALT